MKTSELSGHMLNYWTGRALGKNVKIIKHQREDSYFCVETSNSVMPDYKAFPMPDRTFHPYMRRWNPSENWSIAGPWMIEKKICLSYEESMHNPDHFWWSAWMNQGAADGGSPIYTIDKDPLIAICKVIVRDYFGVEVPDEGKKECQP